MICDPCRDKVHEACVNTTVLRNNSFVKKREEPIKACACQHKTSWNFSVGGKEKTGDHDGNSSQS